MKILKVILFFFVLTFISSAQGVFNSEYTGDEIDAGVRKYKVYTAMVSQGGAANEPTVTVLENTIGNIVWTRFSAGRYRATLTGAFTLNKTLVFVMDNNAPSTPETGEPNDSNIKVFINTALNANFVELRKGYYDSSEGITSYSDGFGAVTFEIRVYP